MAIFSNQAVSSLPHTEEASHLLFLVTERYVRKM